MPLKITQYYYILLYASCECCVMSLSWNKMSVNFILLVGNYSANKLHMQILINAQLVVENMKEKQPLQTVHSV